LANAALERVPESSRASRKVREVPEVSKFIDHFVGAFFSIKGLDFLRKGPVRSSSSSGKNITPIVTRSGFLAAVFGLTDESKRNLIKFVR
jgi:hypothetical protein